MTAHLRGFAAGVLVGAALLFLGYHVHSRHTEPPAMTCCPLHGCSLRDRGTERRCEHCGFEVGHDWPSTRLWYRSPPGLERQVTAETWPQLHARLRASMHAHELREAQK